MAYMQQGQWIITPEERARSDSIFLSLKPQGGYLTGLQAREYFMQSKLPVPILGHIWNLADVDKDGRMTADEFAIAMHLLQAKIRGVDPPSTLPPSLISRSSAATAVPLAGIVPMVVQTGGIPMTVPVAIGALPTAVPAAGVQPTAVGAAAPGEDWIVSHAERLKYNQMFNQLDQRRAGLLTGLQAKAVLVNSGLPQGLLAQIWSLSDIDKDGSLTSEEFALAMHLINRAKSGVAIPAVLNDEMLPPSVRKQKAQQHIQNSPKPEASSAPDIEDRLRENFKLGQAELERRRREAEDMERKHREEVERKQREEEERKRELDRLRREQEERERQRQLEAEVARQRERERILEDEKRREEDRRRRDELVSWARRARTALEDLKEREIEGRRRAQLSSEHLREELSALRLRRGPLQAELDELAVRLRDERVQASRAQEELNVRTMALDEVKFECDETRALLIGLVDQKRSLQRQIEMIQEALAGNNNTQRMQSLLQGVRDSVERLKLEVRTMEADVTIKKAEHASLMTQGQTLRTELITATRLVDQLTDRKRVLLEAEIGRAREEHMRNLKERRAREDADKRERDERERREREERIKRDREERERRDRQDKERREKEEKEQQQRREKEKEMQERREKELREQKEREEREARERKAREEAAAAAAAATVATAAAVTVASTPKKAPPPPSKPSAASSPAPTIAAVVAPPTPAKPTPAVVAPPTPAKPTPAVVVAPPTPAKPPTVSVPVSNAAPPTPAKVVPALPPKELKPKVAFVPEVSVVDTDVHEYNGVSDEPESPQHAAAKPEEAPAQSHYNAAPADVYYSALYDYTAVNADELSFEAGALIRFVATVDNDWLEGELDGVVGLFPATYAVQQEPSHSATNGSFAAGAVLSESDMLAKLEEENQRIEDEKRKAETLIRLDAENRRLEEAQKKKEEARRRLEEEDKKKKVDEDKKKKDEDDRKKKAAALEEEKKRKVDEERKKKEEEEKKKKEEEEKRKKAVEDERKRKEEEEKKRKLEEEEKKKKAIEDERKRKEEEEKKKKTV
eukprot:Opistho-2@34597